MLLLHENHKFIDSYDVPEEVSQNGIANELILRQNHVSRALTELVSDGLIFSRSSHIKGVPRRRLVYFLTQKGTKDISEFINEISSNTVLVHTPGGELKEYTLEKVAEELRVHIGHLPSFHQILTKYYKNNEIDIDFLAKHPGADLEKLKKLNIPLDKRFFGRISECDSIFSAISDDQFKFIVINSIAGQGKTALMVRIVSNIKDRPIFWSALNEWVHPSSLFSDWGYFFKEHKKNNLFNYLGTTPQFNLHDACAAFIKDAKELEPVLVIDDFHKATPEVVQLFGIIKVLLTQGDRSIFLIASRERPGFYGQKDLLVSKLVYEMELKGLDLESASMILKEKGIPEPEFNAAYEVTKGHPLFLELYTPTFLIDDKYQTLEFDAFIGEEVIHDLTDSEAEVMKLASVFPRPVTGRAFFISPEINQETLDKLGNKLILRIYQNGTYDTHDLIKSYFANRMTDFEKEKYLGIASNYYSTCDSEKDILDYLRILHDSNQRSLFIETLLEHGEFLLSQGYTQVGEYIQEIDISEVFALNRIKLFILKSDGALGQGKMVQARAMLKNGLELSDRFLQSTAKNLKIKKEDIVQLISRIYNRSAEISKMEGRMDETIVEYNKNVALNKKYNDKAGLGKALNNLAMAYRERGELDLALKNLLSAEAVFNELGDQSAYALVQVNIGDIYFLKRDFANSQRYFNAAEQASPRIPAVKGAIFRKLGQTRLQLGQFPAAQHTLLEALTAFRKANDLNNRIRVLSDLFSCARHLKKKEIAQGYLDSALKLLDEHQREGMDAELMDELVSEHLRNELIFGTIWSPDDLPMRINKFISFQIRSGNPRGCLESVDELSKDKEFVNNRNALVMVYEFAERYLMTIEDKHPFIIMNIRRASLLADMDRRNEAQTILQKILPIAKRIGFNKAVRRIEEMVKKF
jgi:tetratricopeptide (TPR) repeat protein/DNA-binding MarR family transcriptional regulator